MEKVLHRAAGRGVGDHDWLKSRFSFSFAHWYEPTRMGFGALRVINDDIIAPFSGFGEHSHQNMEIITIVMQGTVTHKDSMGNVGTVPEGDVQVMSAGTGVMHSEYNDSPGELRLFQIWIEPDHKGIAPQYAQKSFGLGLGPTLLVAPDEREGALSVHQQAFITHVSISAGEKYSYEIHDPANGTYVFVIEGTVHTVDETLCARDALGITGIHSISFSTEITAEFLVIEVPVKSYS